MTLQELLKAMVADENYEHPEYILFWGRRISATEIDSNSPPVDYAYAERVQVSEDTYRWAYLVRKA